MRISGSTCADEENFPRFNQDLDGAQRQIAPNSVFWKNMHLMKNRDRALGAMVGLAIGDALGAPVEFRDRDTFALVTDMMPGGYFRLPAGAWTDDTAMALCLLDSLTYGRPFDPKDLLDRFLGWMEQNENTSTGKCIGIGQNTLIGLSDIKERIEILWQRSPISS